MGLNAAKLQANQLLQANDYNGAAKLLYAIIKENPRDVASLEALAQIFHLFGSVDKSLKLSKQILLIAPENAYANQSLSLIKHAHDGEYKKGRVAQSPQQVHFLMNDKCNAKCIMCGGNYWKSKSGKEI